MLEPAGRRAAACGLTNVDFLLAELHIGHCHHALQTDPLGQG
ncbi:hypothetical protein [Thermomicrobium sp.]